MSNTSESLKTRIQRFGFNLFPAFRGTGGRLTCISSDYKYVEVAIPLNRRTRNYVGTIFGGSMFGAVDPVYMVMFYKILGKGYSIWVKSSEIQFLVPGRSTLKAVFRLTQSEIDSVLSELANNSTAERERRIELIDQTGTICATVSQRLFIRKNAH